MATRMGSSSSSLTITQTTPTTLTVRLECPPEQTRPDEHITWAEDVQDNEGLGKKKSKCCCIFHRPHAWNESSDESDGDETHKRNRQRRQPHHHHHDEHCDHS
eukprot:c4477_g1_i2.p2 GENE.c4477_g1_i2~~c4477_g1_i2.p2  ORF type:complete len:103 (+),score=22.79 c4477_g1_i2:70-378(+)